MKNFFRQTLKAKGSTFVIAEADVYHSINSFHSHPELELLYVRSGQGTFSIGESSRRISSGTMILIGANIPHMFKFETNRYYDYAMKHGKTPVPLELLTLHFDYSKLGNEFISLPENSVLINLFELSKTGLIVTDNTKDTAIAYLKKIQTCPNYEQLPLLLQLLNKIGEHENTFHPIEKTSEKPFKKIDESRLTSIYLYTMDNFYREIKLKDIATIVHMVPNAFCHYFKSRTGRSYFDFLIEVRIEHACKLLKEGNESISYICNDSGFSNLSNFNRYFKLKIGKSPLSYRQGHRNTSLKPLQA